MSSFSKYVGNGAQTVYAVNQPMPSYSALEVTLDGEVETAGFTYNRTNATVTFAVAPADGVVVKLSRVTQVEPIHKFATGAAFTARNVDTNFTQESYRVEELQDNVVGVKELEESVLQASEDAEAALAQLLASSTDYIQVGTFAAGYDSLQNVRQTLLYSDGHRYGWTGGFPKKVEAGDSPTPLGAGGWIDRSDVTLRGELAADNGAKNCLSAVATAYGVNFSEILTFEPGNTYDSTETIFFNNALWRPYIDGTTQSVVSYAHFHEIPRRGCAYTPEMFGCSGNGVSNPDTGAFARALLYTPSGSSLWLTPGAEYYNAAPAGISDVWVLNKKLKIVGFGCKLSRRPSLAGENNFATLKLGPDADFSSIIGDIEFDGGEPEELLVNSSGAVISTDTYARALASSHCIHIETAKDVTIDGPYLHHANFCVWAYGADRMKLSCSVFKSGQLYPVTTSDLNLGAGVKLSECNDVTVEVLARYCTNAGLEIEPNNNNINAKVVGAYNYWSDLTITQSHDIIYDCSGHDSKYGVQISTGATDIIGRSVHKACSVAAVSVQPISAAKIDGLDLKIIAHDCLGYGLTHFASAANIDNFNYDVNIKNCRVSNEAVMIRGPGKGFISGSIRGSSVGISPNATTDLYMNNLDISDNTTSYYSNNSAVFGMLDVRTALGMITMQSNAVSAVYNVKQAVVAAGSNNFGPLTDCVTRAANFNIPGFATSGVYSGQLYYDSADGNRVKYKP